METKEFQNHVIDTLARLDTNMKSLVGNGQPGRIQCIEDDVEELKKARWTFGGLMIGVSAAVSSVIHFFFKY
jgi:hypothetical protein